MKADDLMLAAKAQGILPPDCTLPELENKPWPVVLLTTLGAWLTAIPVFVALDLIFGNLFNNYAALGTIGIVTLVATTLVLRQPGLPLFVEQLTQPFLLVGGVCFGIMLFKELPVTGAQLIALVTTLLLAWMIPFNWLRVLLGMLAAGWVAALLTDEHGRWFRHYPWLMAHLLLGLWALGLWTQQTWLLSPTRAKCAALLESLACGWLLTTIITLVLMSGASFMSGSYGWMPSLDNHGQDTMNTVFGASSTALAGLAIWLLLQRWQIKWQAWLMAPAISMVLLAYFLPTLGACLLSLAILLCSARWRQAAVAGLAAAWVIGSFYYLLNLTLTQKAMLLMLCGAVPGALLWWQAQVDKAVTQPATGSDATPSTDTAASGAASLTASATSGIATPAANSNTWLLLASGLICLLLVNGAIWQKQQLIAHGQRILVELQPVDPRSLMQGDYMALNFVPWMNPATVPPSAGERVKVVAERDARSVTVIKRQYLAGESLAANELLLELTPKAGRWVLVSDAFYFHEGEAERFAKARYGEFRVMRDGRALLVGVADKDLQPVKSK